MCFSARDSETPNVFLEVDESFNSEDFDVVEAVDAVKGPAKLNTHINLHERNDSIIKQT
jgi:hypothetical protein